MWQQIATCYLLIMIFVNSVIRFWLKIFCFDAVAWTIVYFPFICLYNVICFVIRRYTPMNGIPCTVWFDRPTISPHSEENITDINEMCDYLDGLVAQEWNDHGIPASRIIVGKNLVINVYIFILLLPSVLWHCWLGGRKGIQPVKTELWGAGMVICLERGADLHTAQLMPLPLTVSCFTKIQIGVTFLVPAHSGSPGKKAVKRVCVCMCVWLHSWNLGQTGWLRMSRVNPKHRRPQTPPPGAATCWVTLSARKVVPCVRWPATAW